MKTKTDSQLKIDFDVSLKNEADCDVFDYDEFRACREKNRRKELTIKFRDFTNSLDW